ncbi:MAG TPA: c-type cytochrome [Stellaceae bacterium]|nr:c-type cytochrome [Stellaceae bacterium]
MKSAACALAGLCLWTLATAGAGTAEAADGAQLFRKYCSVCHDTEPRKNKLCPSLAGVIGRKAGSLDNYSYSPAMQHADITWDAKSLDKYLANPRAFIPNNKMLFVGVKSAEERHAIIDYLATLAPGS